MSAPPRTTIPHLKDLSLDLETPRLKLRPFVEADVDAIWPYTSDPAFPKQMSWSAHTDKAQTLAFIRGSQQGIDDNTGATLAIVQDGKAIGAISLIGIRWELRAWRIDRAELGYWLATPHWGKGLMTEAAHQMLLFAYEELGLHKVTIGCLDGNIGSRRVIEKLGFRFIGRHEEDVWRDGAWHAHLRYEQTASQWSDVATTMPINRPHRP